MAVWQTRSPWPHGFRRVVFEVKPLSILRSQLGALAPKYRAARRYFAERNVGYRVVTERTIHTPRQTNAEPRRQPLDPLSRHAEIADGSRVARSPLGQHAEDQKQGDEARDARAPYRSRTRIPVQAAPVGFARKARSRFRRAPQGDLRARLLLAPASGGRVQSGAYAAIQHRLLAPEAGEERRTR